MKKSVCIILEKKSGKKKEDGTDIQEYLAVSRKDDLELFGLPGGKVDDTDPTTEHAIIREVKEETGLDVFNLKLIDTRELDEYESHCYVGSVGGRLKPNEDLVNMGEGICEWVDKEVIMNGFCGKYNEEMFRILGLV